MTSAPGCDEAINGILTNVVVASTNVTDADFGIQQPPQSDPKVYTIDPPLPDQIIPLDGSHISTGPGTSSPGQLTGSDPEDGILDGSTTNRTLIINTLPENEELWYNGVQLRAGDKISNYDPGLMEFRATGTGYTSITFYYAYLDEAGVESIPAPYTIDWGTSLPVELLSFTASGAGGVVLLKWETADEQNSDHFAIERSANGGSWKEIGRVQAAGNSSGNRSYSFKDTEPLPGFNYYRLKLADKDASYRVSEIRIVRFGQAQDNRVQIVPNPAHDHITLRFDRAPVGRLTVKLLNQHGKTLHAYNLNNIGRIYRLGLPTIARGIYVINIEGENIQKRIKLVIH